MVLDLVHAGADRLLGHAQRLGRGGRNARDLGGVLQPVGDEIEARPPGEGEQRLLQDVGARVAVDRDMVDLADRDPRLGQAVLDRLGRESGRVLDPAKALLSAAAISTPSRTRQAAEFGVVGVETENDQSLNSADPRSIFAFRQPEAADRKKALQRRASAAPVANADRESRTQCRTVSHGSRRLRLRCHVPTTRPSAKALCWANGAANRLILAGRAVSAAIDRSVPTPAPQPPSARPDHSPSLARTGPAIRRGSPGPRSGGRRRGCRRAWRA